MSKERLAAFSDGVLAIILTIMVLELKVPHGHDLAALRPLIPSLLSYVLSFVYVAIYWNNHHHLIQASERVSGPVLWANAHLLFWLSLIPFLNGWIGESRFAPLPVALFGIDLLMAGAAYYLLVRALLACHAVGSTLATALRSDLKEKISIGAYSLSVAVAFFSPLVSCAIYIAVAILWMVPDKRIERTMLS